MPEARRAPMDAMRMAHVGRAARSVRGRLAGVEAALGDLDEHEVGGDHRHEDQEEAERQRGEAERRRERRERQQRPD